MAPLFYINANITGALWLKDDANWNMLHFQKFIYGVERENISVLFFISSGTTFYIYMFKGSNQPLLVLFTWNELIESVESANTADMVVYLA